MLRLDELEKLSRFAAGDLSPKEAEHVKAGLEHRPELADALAQLSRLDLAAEALPQTLRPDELDGLIARVQRPRPRMPNIAVAIAAAALALVASGATLWLALSREPRPRLVALSGSVTLNGVAVPAPSEALPLPPRAIIRCGIGSASIIETREARLLLTRESELALPPELPTIFALNQGTLAATGRQIHLAAGSTRVDLAGRGVLSWEPEEDLVRVTAAMEQNKTQWAFRSLKLPLAATAAAAAGVTVLVLEGRATVTREAAPPVEVAAGQKWTSGNPWPTAITAPTALLANAEPVARKAEQPAAGARAEVDNRNLQALSRDQLVAEVVRLRAQNNSLAERNQEIQRKLEQGDSKEQAKNENYYRADPAELRALAERGEMRLHPPPTLDGHGIYGQNVVSDLGLTPEEEAKIREIYDRSAKAIRDGLVSLYVEIGGDANVANSLDSFALMRELQSKSTDRDAAVRIAIRERGGLEQPGDPNQGSALLRMYRLLYGEEERLIAALDALLGPARAEEFLNHPNASHSTWSTTTGPTPPRP